MDLSEPRALIDRNTRAGVGRVWGDFTIARAEEPGAPNLSATGTVFAMIVQGTKHLEFGRHDYDYGPGEYLVASVDMPVSGYFSQATPEHPALGFGLALRPALIAELLTLPAAAGLPPTGRDAEPGLSVGRLTPELADAATRLLRLIDRPRDLAVLAPLIEREFLWLLLSGEHGAALRQLGLADSRTSRIRRAVHWIREHYAERLRIDELARMTAMSPSSFYRSFAAVTTTSPLQFQKRIRLQEARALLIADPGDVAGAAYAVGYESPSQFSREYRRQFGLPPTQDALRVRSPAA
ncbi:AraC family transcriptional regulator [Allonocardiopsis opalescens]|uniref:AraC-like DNA-binding protein n=1 Tax=Allonocardiopsis opalescens TaxID=1144618 RepID=A0A2T0Q4N3_9ACTN|nr:AraC family transcriptional regulator [Allonocardiopsis opalescens]PRX98661.1 AraC-like DNA-binding protein [Allonocardiopsis opalescens]